MAGARGLFGAGGTGVLRTRVLPPLPSRDVTLDVATAEAIVRARVDPDLAVVAVRQLNGGMVHRVYELETEGEPRLLVAKVSATPNDPGFDLETRALQFARRQTGFPVPHVYGCVSGIDGFEGTAILMERVAGRNLQDARISAASRALVQRQLGLHVAELHRHRRATYGSSVAGPPHDRWLDRFGPTMHAQYRDVRDQLSTQARRVVEYLLTHLDQWLPETHDPRLVHGDLWATNILVDDRHPDRPQILAFIDGDFDFADPEYELAYLKLFHTAGPEFFETYHQHHPRRSGFDRRCRVYWLNTMMLHVARFGGRYLPNVEQLADQVRQLIQ